MKLIKRNGSEVEFDKNKIIVAIKKASKDTAECNIKESQIKDIADYIEFKASKLNRAIEIEDVQDMVENGLMGIGQYDLARNYVKYRYQRALNRKKSTLDDKVLSLVDNLNEEVLQENSNKNPTINSTQRDYIAGEVSKDMSRRLIFSKEVMDAHDKGIIHVHDMDYSIQHSLNCCLVDLEGMFKNGTVISKVAIDTPRSIRTAATIATQVMAQVASVQYGGQSINLAHLAPFIDVSRQKIRKSVVEELSNRVILDDAAIDAIVEGRVREEVKDAVQTMQYQILTLNSSNGQSPFVTLFCYLGDSKSQREKDDLAMLFEEILKQRIQGVKNEKGVYVTPSFPKIIYTLDEDNIHPESEYYWLTTLAAKCTAKRLVPDYVSAKVMRELKEGNVYAPMGCRSFLNTWKDENGNYKFYGRSNMGVVTINLPYIALLSGKDEDKFWKELDKYLELCYTAHMSRYARLKDMVSDYAPIMWQHGALTRLKPGEKVTKYLEGGYCSISLGYAGIYETVKYMTGESHISSEIGKEFGIRVMHYLNDKCTEWKKRSNLAYSLYGTPIESTTYKFAKALQKGFGMVEGISDHNYITNSYHCCVREEIDAFDKLTKEAEFQKLSLGGCISYVECPNMSDNIPAVLTILKHIYNHIMYAELNVKSDFCQECGWDKEIPIKETNGKLVWTCPNCGCTDQNKLNIARRTCG